MHPTTEDNREMKGPAPLELARAKQELLLAQLLLEHIRALPKEAMDTFLALAPEIVNCEIEQDREELAEAVREVLAWWSP